MSELPRRLTTAEVCELARFSPATLQRRIRAGTMPSKVDRGRQALFDRDAVLKALGMVKDEQEPLVLTLDREAFFAARKAQVREACARGGRAPRK